jgi:hypothetical protein
MMMVVPKTSKKNYVLLCDIHFQSLKFKVLTKKIGLFQEHVCGP